MAKKWIKNSIVIIGMGEMAGVFSRGFLRSGYPVIPVTREMDIKAVADELPEPQLILVAVAENDLQSVLSSIPDNWKSKLVLLQNELLPNDWLQHKLTPTVISVWFEKKKGQDFKVLIASPVYGNHAGIIVESLKSIDIAARELNDENELLFELVVKNVYILTTNIAGLKVGGNVSELWEKHQTLCRIVATEIIELQEKLCGKYFSNDELINAMLVAFQGDPNHNCMGRSAPGRLARALLLAKEYDLHLPTLEEISKLSQ